MILEQLLRNAIASSPTNSVVRLTRTIFEDGMLAIAVSDTGSGMHPEFVARTLDGRRALCHKAGNQGRNGFGLPFAKAVAESHGGRLEIRSMVGDGTTAMLIFPPDRVFERAAAAA